MGTAGRKANPNKKAPEKTAQQGTKEGEERFSIILKSEQIEAMRNIAYWKRKYIKDVYIAAIDDYLNSVIADPKNKSFVKGGKIQPQPIDE